MASTHHPQSPFLTLPLAPGQLIAGKYAVERVLGEGGMGVVLAAQQLELGRRVAIKLLLPEVAALGMAAERFRREARAAARIRGEHVCQVMDVGTLDNGVPFMVMEYLDGHDLAAELALRGRLPYQEAALYVLQACDAVAAAHEVGVIHRDLKPANLFLERCAGGARRIKVLDFGVSKSLLDAPDSASALTQTSHLLGSPLYMSPEQLDSAKSVDARTDIWSLGVVLYELIAGQTPFDGDSIAQLVTAVLQAAAPRLSDQVPQLPRELDAVVARALARPRSDRFASVGELARALAVIAAQPSAAGDGRSLAVSPQPGSGSQPEAASEGGRRSADGRDGGGPRQPRRLPLRAWLLVCAVCAVCAVAGLSYRQRAGAPDQRRDSSAPVKPPAPKATNAQASAASDPDVAVTAPPPSAAEAEAPRVEQRPSPASQPAPPQAAVPTKQRPPRAPEAARTPTPDSAHGAPTITDFGGRR